MMNLLRKYVNNPDMNPQISVIVPVYNAERYLHRCVDSILAQTYTDFELILVDDGSKDSSGLICDEYAANDSRVRVFHKPNGGVSSARNLGLDNARGEWVNFIDSDDYVLSSYLGGLYDNCICESCMVMGYATLWENGSFRKENYKSRRCSTTDLSLAFIKNDLDRRTSPWGKLFNRKIIDSVLLRFNECLSLGEDAHFVFSYLRYVSEINIISNADYVYNVDREYSLTKRINSYNSELTALECIGSDVNWMFSRINNSASAKGKLTMIIGEYQRRVLNSLYASKCPKMQRINALGVRGWREYIETVKENSFQGRVYQYLLRKKYYRVYDFTRTLSKLLKRLRFLESIYR